MASSSSGRTTQAQIYEKLTELAEAFGRMDVKIVHMNEKIDNFSSKQNQMETSISSLRSETEVDIQAIRDDIRDIKNASANASATTDARFSTLTTTLDRVEHDVSKIKTERLIAGARMSIIMGGAGVVGGVLFFFFQNVLKPIVDLWIKKEFGG